MDKVLGILQSLGVNSSIWTQMGIFFFVFLFLKFFVFEAYLKAYLERQNQTTGSQDEAEKVHAKARELETIYQRKARNLNAEIKAAFDQEKLKAQQEHERILIEAKDKAKSAIDGARSVIQQEYMRAREELLKETRNMGDAMASRLMTKE